MKGKERADSEVRFLQGIGASPGIVSARVIVLKRHTWRAGWYHLPGEHIEKEVERFFQAVIAAAKELVGLKEKLAPDLDDALSIMDSHLLMLKDKMIYDQTVAIIREKNVNAEWALAQALTSIKERFDRIDDAYIKERYTDIKHVADRIFGLLAGREHSQLHGAIGSAIVVANSFSPEDILRMHGENILGFLSEKGGVTSHTAIVARSLGIPAVVGLEHATSILATGEQIILDGSTGRVILNPAPEEICRYQEDEQRRQALTVELERYIYLSSETFDGYTVRLSANIEVLEELPAVLRYGSEGIGLFRSEFDYFHGRKPPSEEHLLATYSSLLDAMAPHPVTVRTLDVGGDKMFKSFPGGMAWMDQERNPALGLRSIRFSLHEIDLLRVQLRALLRASVHGTLRILLPMVSALAELRRTRDILAEVRASLDAEGLAHATDVELGIMIEVPSAVIMADVFAAEVDFFSIGTNDLIQYTLAIDRGNQYVAHLYDPFHPAVLRMIGQTVEAGHGRNIPVSVCGEMAGDVMCAPVLLGLGVDELSMRPAVIPRIKRMLRSSNFEQLRMLGQEILQFADSDQVRAFLADNLPQYYPYEFKGQ